VRHPKKGMKAIFFESHGDIDVLRYGELPVPQPRPQEALVRVRAVALNHLDIWVRRGWKGLRVAMPHITGADVAGEIVSLNSNDGSWSAGARVIVNPGIITAEDQWTHTGQDSVSPGYQIMGEQVKGGLAEFVSVPMANLLAMPDELSYHEAAAPLLAGVTCWRMLFKRAALQAGETVLVVGSGGGVNSLTILLAKSAGATVIALGGGPSKTQKALTLGADYVIDYTEHPEWSAEVLRITKGRGADVVVDNVGAATITKSLRSVARAGRVVTVGNTSGPAINIDNRLLFTKQVSLLGSTMGSREDFIDATNFIFSRKIRIPIDTVAPLSDGIRQLKRLEKGEQFGKIVLTPSE
jgi:NADPH:quinone reductase-like Zn-dependent oxidoreductase